MGAGVDQPHLPPLPAAALPPPSPPPPPPWPTCPPQLSSEKGASRGGKGLKEGGERRRLPGPAGRFQTLAGPMGGSPTDSAGDTGEAWRREESRPGDACCLPFSHIVSPFLASSELGGAPSKSPALLLSQETPRLREDTVAQSQAQRGDGRWAGSIPASEAWSPCLP